MINHWGYSGRVRFRSKKGGGSLPQYIPVLDIYASAPWGSNQWSGDKKSSTLALDYSECRFNGYRKLRTCRNFGKKIYLFIRIWPTLNGVIIYLLYIFQFGLAWTVTGWTACTCGPMVSRYRATCGNQASQPTTMARAVHTYNMTCAWTTSRVTRLRRTSARWDLLSLHRCQLLSSLAVWAIMRENGRQLFVDQRISTRTLHILYQYQYCYVNKISDRFS